MFKKSKAEPPAWEATWDKIRELYPIGCQFDYLGRKMIVVAYSFFNETAYAPFTTVAYAPFTPCFLAEYADDTGVLHSWCFTVKMAPILLNNPPPLP